MFNIKFKITNLTCAACVKLSEAALKKISGVVSATVDLTSGFGTLEAVRDVAPGEVITMLKSVGKEAEVTSD